MGLNLAIHLIGNQLKGDIDFEVADGTSVAIRFKRDKLGTASAEETSTNYRSGSEIQEFHDHRTGMSLAL